MGGTDPTPMRLVTTWYGSFVIDDDDVVLASAPFPKDPKAIAERLRLIRESEVLEEEVRVAPKDGGFHVSEGRLCALEGAALAKTGSLLAGVPSPEELGMPPNLLRDASLELASSSLREALPPDQPVILYLRAMDLVEREGKRALEMLRYWHAFHFPELGALLDDEAFLHQMAETADREEILASRPEFDPTTIGGRPLSPGEDEAMAAMARHVLATQDEGRSLRDHLEVAIKGSAPNLAMLAGPLVGARLLNQAGSLERLARMPSSTVQLLGAEKALFLHIKEGAPPPKHGVVFQHPAVHSAPPWLRGRIARRLAGKISIATRADLVETYPDGELGARLREEFLERVQRLRSDNPSPPTGWRRRSPRTVTVRRKGGQRGRVKGRGRPKRGRR